MENKALRDAAGRFVRGSPGGPGRPPRAAEERFLDLLQAAISDADWILIVQRAIEQAKRGDNAARQFLASYSIGRPVERLQAEVSSAGVTLAALLMEVRDALPEGDDEAEG